MEKINKNFGIDNGKKFIKVVVGEIVGLVVRNAMPVAGKPRSPISFLAKPKFCEMRPVHSRFGHQPITTGTNKNRKLKFRQVINFRFNS